MKLLPLVFAPRDAVARITRQFPSFRDFVDDALFHPAWGYYSTGQVRFGEGGHYDTFPLALSPVFGEMVARYAYRSWRRLGEPGGFEICELGAGNGQLCLDVLLAVNAMTRAAHRRFARALRYRIIERSPALIARQREHLGALAKRVRWTEADLSQRVARGAPFGPHGVVFANEVLDCLAHHKVIARRDGGVGVVFVMPVLVEGAAAPDGLRVVAGLARHQRAIRRGELARVFADERLRRRVTFQEVVLPIEVVRGLRPFLRRHCPEFFYPGKDYPPYFASPAMAALVRNSGRLYNDNDVLWIDYGENRGFHLATPERRRVFAGPPRSGATAYRAPGLDDITFMVDFSVVRAEAERAGLAIEFYGGQGELARRSGVVLERRARAQILQYRTLSWMLAVMGVGPERAWRHTGLTWSTSSGGGGRLRDDIARSIAEFLGRRRSHFKLMILRRAREHQGPGRR